MEIDLLDRALLEAHARRDTTELIRLYSLAAEECEAKQDIGAACFFLTQAFVFALESGAEEAFELNQKLADRGRVHRFTSSM
ncbi:hypothetical protein [Ruegeria arenilitoris]|uniref:hypothetical protein n=1 Tax=Ruegeria arenilitoris TaxID=1173585 RepID=UPI00147B6CAC|nr:hypothetical protein [Ruegeria arenilitoris]